jgi:hypothetical protein
MLSTNNSLIILVLILFIVYFFLNKKEEAFTNTEQITQNYEFVPKKILKLENTGTYISCNNDEIQIGEMCKNLYTNKYRKICNKDEKYSDGYCVKNCPDDMTNTGNPYICLSKCPKGTVDDGFNCINFKFIEL